MMKILLTSPFLVGSFLTGALVGGFSSNTDDHLATVTTNQAPQWALREVKEKDGSWSVGRMRPDGTKEGLWQQFGANGWQEAEGEWKNGKQEGRWTYWHKNGQKWEEGEYKNGKEEGRWTYWNENGTIIDLFSGIYKAGKKVAPLPKKK